MTPPAIRKGMQRDIASGIFITVFIYAISLHLPLIGIFFALFLPLPILIYRIKLGRNAGGIIVVLSSAAMIALVGPFTMDIVFFIELLVIGFMLSEFAEMNLSVEKTILYASLAVLATSGVGMLLFSSFNKIGITALLSDHILKSLKLTVAIYEHMGVSQQALNDLSNSLERIQYVLVRIVPALAIGSTLFIAWANLLMARPILLSRKLFYPNLGALNRWKAPEALVWGVICSGILLLIPEKGIKMIGLNGLIVFMTIYFFEGIAIVSFYFEKKKLPKIFRIGLYSIIALQQIVCLLVIGIGFFDTWLNFRKIDARPQETV